MDLKVKRFGVRIWRQDQEWAGPRIAVLRGFEIESGQDHRSIEEDAIGPSVIFPRSINTTPNIEQRSNTTAKNPHLS
jgi:hypothetical protein